MSVVPNQISVSVHQTAGQEKERSQNRTSNLFEDTLHNEEMFDSDR
jgi:hypothetical protein